VTFQAQKWTRPDPATLCGSRDVRTYFGGVSDMWLHRRLRDSKFPTPVMTIKGRRFWRWGDIYAWEASQRSNREEPPRHAAE
jgi:hypothetical protein